MMIESSGNSGMDTPRRWAMLFWNAMSAAPTLSVIVVCKNPGARLHATLASVWAQSGIAGELIAIDGGSTDGSRDWLESQRERIATLVSKPDAGVYDAMNKGLAAARGEWVIFLGADDRLAGDRVLAEAAISMGRTDAGVVAGEAAYDDGRIYRLASRVNPIARNFVHHQAAFYRRTLLAGNGGFDTSLAIMADYDLNLRLWQQRVRFEPIPVRVATCGVGGLSDRGGWSGYREEIAVRHRHFSAIRCLVWDGLSAARYVRKKIVRSLARN
jgi:glycosyltransferase involved in cell wall biosynthesis